MLILAMDTSSKAGSVALFDGKSMLESRQITATEKNPRPSASNFSSHVSQLFADNDRLSKDLDVIAISVGPGSFTGLRVGVVAAKTLAYALNCKVVALNSLAAIAAAAIEETSCSSVCTVMDAQRGQLFAAQFESAEPWSPRMLNDVQIIEKAQLADFAGSASIAGPGLEKLSQDLAGFTTVDRHLWSCNAEIVGRISIPRIEANSFDDHWTLKPNYYRASAAEEKRQSQSSS